MLNGSMNNARFLRGRLSTWHYRHPNSCRSLPFSSLLEHEVISHPTSISLASALQQYINSDTPRHGQNLHTYILKTGFVPNTNISIKLLILHVKAGCLRYARQVFDELAQPTLSAYNYMISGYIKQGMFGDSYELVRKMVFCGERPDGFTLSMLLKASTASVNSSPCEHRNMCSVVHCQILKLEIEPDDVLYTALIDSYVKSGKLDRGRTVFDMMLEENVICSTSMITGYMNQGSVDDAEEIFLKTSEKDIVVFNAMIEGYSKSNEFAEKALDIFIEMQRLNYQPNISSFASIIGACSMLTSYEISQQIHCLIMKTPLYSHIKLGSALIDMYSKCGKTEDALQIFVSMSNKNVFSWTSMIDGYGKNGEPHKALELFNSMQKLCIEPNLVTFLGALSACAHAGLVNRGREIFNSMERNYLLKPSMEHYACMVDLLGRSGSLSEAWDFVMAMPERPNSDVWAALLSSCRIYGDVEMARYAANEIFKLNSSERPGAYVALSNTLADAGKWDSVSELRELMNEKGVSKDTACSWVGADDAQLL